MRHIQKGPEPPSWVEYRATPGVIYQPTSDLRMALLAEQGHLCGYCMKRISHDATSVATTRIEHIKCQSKHPDHSLDYKNMILCCDGAEGMGPANYQCDRLKQDSDLSFSPLDERVLSLFTFPGSGFMKASSPAIQAEIGTQDEPGVLNLNNTNLIRNRKAVVDSIQTVLGKGTWSKADLRRKLEKYQEKDSNGKYESFCQVVIYYLNKKLRR